MTRDELRAAGFEVSEAEYARLARFVQYLLEENERLNLIAVHTAPEVWRGHVCDSLALVPWLRQHEAARLLDLGSGGGLPGVPLACACDQVNVTLVDATGKKVAAVQRIITRLELANARALSGRAETLAHAPGYREAFDAVTARAVATLPVLLEYAAGFVRVGGHCWFFKSATAASVETALAKSAAQACGLRHADTLRYQLPGDVGARVLIGYRKEGALEEHLPRPPGRARKQPL